VVVADDACGRCRVEATRRARLKVHTVIPALDAGKDVRGAGNGGIICLLRL
jgi:hypothetical protein